MTKKKIITLVLAIFIGLVVYVGVGISDYLEFRKVATASSSMPAQDAGRITIVKPVCVLDTPVPPAVPTTCAISCPMVTSVLGPACTGYIEVVTTGQLGTPFLAVPHGFMYKGGGSYPQAGMSFLYGGASNAQPWVIGIPSMTASRVQKLVDAFNVFIAGFKN